MTDIFREVDEELKQEQLKTLWRRYGTYIIALLVVIVAGVGGYQGWKAWDLEQRLEQSDRYAAALGHLQEGNRDQAEEILAALIDAGDGYAVLATFEQAGLKVEEGDLAGAIALWDQIASDTSLSLAFRGLATALSVMHQIDEGDAAVLEARLEPLAEEGNPFRPTALELMAALALRSGDQEKAREHFTMIADDPAAPASARTRAAQMLEVLDG